VEVGTVDGTDERELHEAFNPETTAAFYFTDRTSDKRIPLARVAEIAHSHGAPVIVDAASELPPKKNLKRYFSKGADLVIISGGKFISGPNNSGLLAGRRDLVKLAHLNAYPFHGIGRGSKMSRETIVGLVTALKIYLKLDEEPLLEEWERKARWMADKMKTMINVKMGVTYQTSVEEKESMWPLCYVDVDEEALGMTARDLSRMLRDGDPSIEARARGSRLVINPEFLLEGDESIVTDRIRGILSNSAA
jgi:L-seryl-tRNA(Ser) seleniumtransferase